MFIAPDEELNDVLKYHEKRLIYEACSLSQKVVPSQKLRGLTLHATQNEIAH